MSLIDYLAERICEDSVAFPAEIETDDYVFIYSPQDVYSFQMWEEYVDGMGILEVRKWNDYKLYCTKKLYGNRAFYNDQFYMQCPSGNVYFFTMHYKHTPIKDLLWQNRS